LKHSTNVPINRKEAKESWPIASLNKAKVVTSQLYCRERFDTLWGAERGRVAQCR